jgi:hypothetical protein
MEKGRVVRKIFESKLKERRRMGRPRKRRLENVEKIYRK